MRIEEIFAIDVGAEVATLCSAQLQGPWQLPAEVVRLAIARGASRVEIARCRGGLQLEIDGVAASPDELADLVTILDASAEGVARQNAISRIEGGGGSALMWLCGFPGARLRLSCRSGGRDHRIEVRRGSAELGGAEAASGPPGSSLRWWCSRRQARRAVAWLRTSLRFVPIPVLVDGRTVDRGFSGGLYRMRLADPLPAEIAVTDSGDAPILWLLEHGVLSARAVVPGFPAFSAAVEMGGIVASGASAAELRTAANPNLPRLIDQAVRMMGLLVDRLPSVEEPVRSRLTTLLLRWAILDERRDQIMALPMVRLNDCSVVRMITPAELGRIAERRGGIISAVDPATVGPFGGRGLLVEATAEERSLLAELLGVRFEQRSAGSGPWELGMRVHAAVRRGWARLRAIVGPRSLGRHELTSDEVAFLDAAATAGVEIELTRGSGPARSLGSRTLVGRDRPEVRAAVGAAAEGAEWLYPALLAAGGDASAIGEGVRLSFLELS